MANKTQPPVQVDRAWFERQFKKRRLSAADVARSIGIAGYNMSKFLAGQRRLKIHEAQPLAYLLLAPAEEVLRRAGIGVLAGNHAPVQVMGTVGPGGRVYYGRDTGGAPDAIRPPVASDSLVAVRARGFNIMDGWVFYYDSVVQEDPAAIKRLHGRLCVVQILDGECYLRELARSERRHDRWTLVPFCVSPNFKAIENIEVESATPVLWTDLTGGA
jgi:hypothetical protein